MPSFGVIIPARFNSSRFPGKPLADLGGKTVLQRVIGQVEQCYPNAGVAVATDDIRIAEHAGEYCEVVMTSANHSSGTDRIAEAYVKLGWNCDVVVNVQGDEPFIQPKQIEQLVQCFKNESTQIATLKFALHSVDEIQNPNAVKVVTDRNGHALYFSRNPIPFRRNQDMEVEYFRHVGIYAFRPAVLQAITQLAVGTLEEIEMLEQLRWLENGYKIQVAETDFISPAVDTPEDLLAALEFLKGR